MGDIRVMSVEGTDYTIKDITARRLIGQLTDSTDLLSTHKINVPLDENNQPTYGENGQNLRTKGNGLTEWVDQGLPTDEQTAEAVSNWLNNHPEATTTVQDYSLTNKKLVRGTLGFVTPEMYGAVGDGTTDDTEALQAAIDSGCAVLLGKAHYKITDTLTGVKALIGGGMKISYIEMYDSSKPMITLENGENYNINNLCLKYVGTVQENSNAFYLPTGNVGQSIFNGLLIDNVHSGFYSNGNIYSCTFSNIWINKYSYAAIYLNATGATGCVFSNIYTTNWEDYSTLTRKTAYYGIFIKGYSECIMQQINIEHTRLRCGILINNCSNIKINSIHFEGFIGTDQYNGFIDANLSSVIIGNWTIAFSGSNSSGYQESDAGAVSQNLIGIFNESSVFVESIFMRDNAWAYATNKKLAYGDGNGYRKDLNVLKFVDNDNQFSGTTGLKTNIRNPEVKSNGTRVFYDIAQESIVRYVINSYSELNLTDKLYIGDRFIPAKLEDNIFEWVVTKEGDMSQTEFAAKGKYTQWTSQLKMTAAEPGVRVGTRIRIGSTDYEVSTGPYGTSDPSYPYAVNLTTNITEASAENCTLKFAPPEITALKYVSE